MPAGDAGEGPKRGEGCVLVPWYFGVRSQLVKALGGQRMRNMAVNGPLSVRALAGTYVVLLGIDREEDASRGVLGFAIERTDPTGFLRTSRPPEGAGSGSISCLVNVRQHCLVGRCLALTANFTAHVRQPCYRRSTVLWIIERRLQEPLTKAATRSLGLLSSFVPD